MQNKNEKYLFEAVFKIFKDQYEGLKKRNLFERKWVSLDFKKNTCARIDEMQTTMKNFGDAIKKGASTMEFFDSVTKVMAY